MEIIYSTGCTNNSLTIDGKETCEMSVSELRDNVSKALNKVDDISILQSIIIDIVESIWEDYECGEQCEECGDVPETYRMEV